ncbi:MAG: hypothetical protein RL160_297, partial [Bacteroidota bacterium]
LAVGMCVIHRLFAEVVTSNGEGLQLMVPNGNGKHAFQFSEYIQSPATQACKDDFRIGLALVGIIRQLFLQQLVVVNFTI